MEERVPGATGAEETEAFARLLRELKDRSGLSYGALAKRLHTGTSTLHRYCNSTAVPSDYAPVERLARVCRATPQELVELHRHWILADAARGRRADPAVVPNPAADSAQAPASGSVPAPAPLPASGSARGARPDGEAQAVGSSETVDAGAAEDSAERADTTSNEPDSGLDSDSATLPGSAAALAAASGTDPTRAATSRGQGPGQGEEGGESADVDAPREPAPSRRRRTVATSFVAVAALLGVVMAVVHPFSDDEGNDAGDRRAAGPAAAITGAADATERPTGRASSSPSPHGTAPASAVTTDFGNVGPGASKSGGTQGAREPSGDSGAGAVPLHVGIRPYVYNNPCSQHFLVDSAPEQVGPPANERDAPRWASAYGAVSSNEQKIALTIQGRGQDTVVLEALHLRVVGKSAPLAWNDYSMGVGCGGGVETKSFDIDLDKGSPVITAKNGQGDFPYKVSASDPEVFYVTVHTKAHDVRWDLTLDWSSGDRRGTEHIDNKGTPFRTSADAGRPGYDYPLGGGEWVERQE
ncbi:helix-turn-helix domain-containing protein [Embleya sp. NPDC127516]|uniref:transcriptional regulator n=1 Tax=Embleya sp. NPDC127516 TaxID=3363990 RepID=UPI003808B87C